MYGMHSYIDSHRVTGKTVQVVTFLEHLYEIDKIRGPYLVCVPLSTIQHWKRESDSWTNMITCLYHDAGMAV